MDEKQEVVRNKRKCVTIVKGLDLFVVQPLLNNASTNLGAPIQPPLSYVSHAQSGFAFLILQSFYDFFVQLSPEAVEKMGGIPMPLRVLGTAAAVAFGGMFSLSLASSVTIRIIQAATEAKRKKVALHVSQAYAFVFALLQKKVALPCSVCKGKGFYICKLCNGKTSIECSFYEDDQEANAMIAKDIGATGN
ncbi:hypothetical protein ACLOJK_031955 [Asimina triloba]